MLFEFDYLFDKFDSEMFRENAIAASLKKLYDAYSRNIIQGSWRRFFRKNHTLYNEKEPNPLISYRPR